MTRMLQTLAALTGILGAQVAFATINKTMKFSKPTNRQNTNVVVEVDPGPDVTVPIPPNTSAEQKRNLIRDALIAAGYDVVDNGAGGNELTIKHLANGTKVKFQPGSTGERRDDVLSTAAIGGTVAFEGHFSGFDQEFPTLPAVFTAGIVTDLGELSAQISAQELNFQTDGPIICQALFQRLAPRAPQYGAQINYAGDRLEVYFDPAYTVTQGGIIFGTGSQDPGCSGDLQSGVGGNNPCPGDINGDGLIDLTDLGMFLAAFGMPIDQPGYNPGADFDGDGDVDLNDLTEFLSRYGMPCQ
jgi:hypothetical protein